MRPMPIATRELESEKEVLTGLTAESVLENRKIYGKNTITTKKRNESIDLLIDILKEPMVIILLVISVIYMSTGNYSDAIIIGLAIVIISSISAYQNLKSKRAINELTQLQKPLCKVIRDGTESLIMTENVVVNDLIVIEEGSSVSADGIIVAANDLSIDEAILTGESLPVFKSSKELAYKGTLVSAGRGIVRVEAIGDKTRLAKIGHTMENVMESKSPLAIDIEQAVKKMIFIGALVFMLVWIMSYQQNNSIVESLIFALTIAMSIQPEEIPIAFSTFMALGSRRLIDEGVLVKNGKTIEALGNTTVICSDKTGTITQNKMAIASCYDLENTYDIHNGTLYPQLEELLWLSRLASEPTVYDPMELAIEDLFQRNNLSHNYEELEFVHEYPLGGQPPLMTHIYKKRDGEFIVACKGAPEAFLSSDKLSNIQQTQLKDQLVSYTSLGYRVLGVGLANFTAETFPEDQHSFDFIPKGLIAFYDPPKEGISEVFKTIEAAGIDTKIITGDNKATAQAIAKQIAFTGYDNTISGEELMKLNKKEQAAAIHQFQLFARMYPEAKLSIIETMKGEGEVVTMLGDGVNDGPALRSAHIGVAMGRRGSEVAKQAADLVLVHDDLAAIIPAIKMGRRIHANLKKAVSYIMSIHIPIVLMVFLPLALGWRYSQILTPVHVIILELIMGPTCSIVYENEPADPRIMDKQYWSQRRPLFNSTDMFMTVAQGLAITCGLVVLYHLATMNNLSESTTRTMIFTAMISANLFLTLTNRSPLDSIVSSLRTRNNLISIMLIIVMGILIIINTVPAAQSLLGFSLLNSWQITLAIIIGGLSVLWYEIVKYYRRRVYQENGL